MRSIVSLGRYSPKPLENILSPQGCLSVPHLPKQSTSKDDEFLEFKWLDGTTLPNVKAKYLYSLLTDNEDIIEHVSSCCEVTWIPPLGRSCLNHYGVGWWNPRRNIFLWRLILDMIPLKKPNGDFHLCTL